MTRRMATAQSPRSSCARWKRQDRMCPIGSRAYPRLAPVPEESERMRSAVEMFVPVITLKEEEEEEEENARNARDQEEGLVAAVAVAAAITSEAVVAAAVVAAEEEDVTGSNMPDKRNFESKNKQGRAVIEWTFIFLL
mmetsp:Transcript_17671/g.38650  ORF Transcript_17671/g.38650 Transcript_17671/m.38650 type:complete len:138 (+) Transcript_17671:914-1327(+)